jgi:hypothetical protein
MREYNVACGAGAFWRCACTSSHGGLVLSWFPFGQLVTSAAPQRPVHPFFASLLDVHVFFFSF